MIVARFRCPTGEIAIEEAVLLGGGLELRLLEDGFVQRRQRAGGTGIGGVARERKGLAAAAAEIDLTEFAGFARLLHPAGAAIAVERLRVLPDPGNGVIGAHRLEFEAGD